MISTILVGFMLSQGTSNAPAWLEKQLTKADLEVCLNASSAADARKFFVDGLGLTERRQPQRPTGAMATMMIFEAGNSGIKVRTYSTTPSSTLRAIDGANGLRIVTVPILSVDKAVDRLKALGFETEDPKTKDGVVWAVARTKDGIPFELIQSSARNLELGFVVSDAEQAKTFFGDHLGAKILPTTKSRLFPGTEELRFSTGSTVYKVWEHSGTRPDDQGQIASRLGFRYMTHNVKSASEVHARLKDKGATIVSPPADYSGTATIFFARSPGGTQFEFLSPGGLQKVAPTAPDRSRQAPGSTQADALFDRLDRNKDGTITRQELPNIERFDVLDKNKDGSISKEEFRAGFGAQFSGGGNSATAERVDPKAPELNVKNDRPFLDFAFKADYSAVKHTQEDPLSRATEANALVPHNGMLFCSVSYMPESKKLTDLNPKVLVKKSFNSPWEVDLNAGSDFMRLGFMHSVKFTTDGTGKKLKEPVSVLVAGTGSWRSQPTGVEVFSRNDKTTKWVRTELSPDRWNKAKLNHTTEVRCIFDHVDRVTGVHMVLAGSATGRIYRGVYDPSEPGLIKWDKTPEVEGLLGHVLCSAKANGVQYVGIAYGATEKDIRQDPDRPVKDHGLFRRIDGKTAKWEWVPIKEWEDPRTPGRSLRTSQLRGMTAIPRSDGKGEDLLIAWDTRDAAIERIEPLKEYKTTTELEVRKWIAEQWGRSVGVSTFAYNDMLPIVHPKTGEKAHLIGLWLVDPRGETNEIGKSSWYLVRYPDKTYRYQRLWDPSNPLTDAKFGLRGLRSIRPSPFPEEKGRVWYFSGFDQTGARGDGATGPAAWIYRGVLN